MQKRLAVHTRSRKLLGFLGGFPAHYTDIKCSHHDITSSKAACHQMAIVYSVGWPDLDRHPVTHIHLINACIQAKGEMNQLPPPLLPSFDSPIGHMAYLPPAASPEEQHLIQSHGRPTQQQAAAMHAAALAQQSPQTAAAMASMRHFSLANIESFLPMQPMLDTNALVAPEAASALANMAAAGAYTPAGTRAQVRL
jgi:hypothetical protein